MINSLFFLLFTSNAFASLTKCGVFTGSGIIKVDAIRSFLVINEKSQSEYQIYFSVPDQAKIVGFKNRDVTTEFLTTSPFNGTVVNATDLLKVSLRIPEPMKPDDTKLVLQVEKACHKKH